MTYYLDKYNNVLFIKVNSIDEKHLVKEIGESIKDSELPYKIVYLGTDNELIII